VKVTASGVPVNELIRVIKASVKRAGVSPTADLQVASVQLILNVIATSTSGGGLNFRLPVLGMQLRVGGKITRRDTHTLDLTLTPPAQQPGYEIRDNDIEDTIVDAISTIRAVITNAIEGEDPWVLSTGVVDISFAITETGTISLGVEGELSNEITHTLRLGLAPT
jgi:Trypsin-co-occurring domain 2